jgi:hypothetical protein
MSTRVRCLCALCTTPGTITRHVQTRVRMTVPAISYIHLTTHPAKRPNCKFMIGLLFGLKVHDGMTFVSGCAGVQQTTTRAIGKGDEHTSLIPQLDTSKRHQRNWSDHCTVAQERGGVASVCDEEAEARQRSCGGRRNSENESQTLNATASHVAEHSFRTRVVISTEARRARAPS